MTNQAPQSQRIRKALEEFERPLVRYAHRMTGNLETARDIVQDTFLRLIRSAPDDVEDHLAEWLFTVCRNRCIDVLRKERRMTGMSDAHQHSLQPHDGTPKGAEHSEQHLRVLAAVEALPPRQAEVIRLKFQNGLSYKEISRVTDLTVTNVGFLIHTGLKTVRERMQMQASRDERPSTNINFGIAR